jgi:CRISPR-associated protein Cst2
VRHELADLLEDGTVRLDHPRVLLSDMAERIERGEHDSWFDDPER